MIDAIRERLVARGWRVINDSPLAVLDVVPPSPDADIRGLVKQVVASGRAWAAPVAFEGRDAVRICATHGESSMRDVEALVAALCA